MAAMKPVWGTLMALSVAWAGGSAGELKTFGYGYHAGGTVAAKAYPSGRVVRECADAMGRAVWAAVTAGYVTGAR